MKSRREIILGTVDDLVSDFLYYDRKGDEELGRGEIDSAISKGEITVDEIAEYFKNKLIDGLSE